MPPERLVGSAVVARWLGVEVRTVTQWLRRYPPESEHPCPEPDVLIEVIVKGGRDIPGWSPTRETDWRTWNEDRKLRTALTDRQVAEIRARWAAGGVTQQRLADEYGVTAPYVNRLVHGQRRSP